MHWIVWAIIIACAFAAIMAGIDTWKNRHRLSEAMEEQQERAKQYYDEMYG